MLKRLESWWPNATVLMVTHDVHEALTFPRVVAMANGRIVNDGSSHVRRLANEQERSQAVIDGWRTIRVVGGQVR